MITNQMAELQERTGYRFTNDRLLATALTHSSATNKEQNIDNYERLEFLGDRVLGLVIAELIYKRYPQEREGDLAKRHAALVQGHTLAIVARRIDLGAAMILSDSERAAGGAGNEHILSDSMEALIGATYLDGGLAPCMQMIAALWDDLLDTMLTPPQDPKTELQEWAQGRGLPLPEYELVERTGPDHAPIFEISVRVKGFPNVRGEGPSRRQAEKHAAQRLLSRLPVK